MGGGEYLAFLCYSRRHAQWAAALRKNIELAIEHHHRNEKIFHDEVDVTSGRSSLTQIQAGLDQAKHLILVVTPEALASHWVVAEWEGFAAGNRPAGVEGIHLLHLVETPLPPFLARLPEIDLREHDAETYRAGLAQLLTALIGTGAAGGPRELPPVLEIPDSPAVGLPPALRGKILDWLEPVLAKGKTHRRSVALSLGLEEKDGLSEYPSLRCAASAALVLACGDEEAKSGALRALDGLADALDEGEPERAALAALRAEVDGWQPPGAGPGLLERYLHTVMADHRNLVPIIDDETGLDLLTRVYVEVQLKPDERGTNFGDEVIGRPQGPLEIEKLLSLDRTAYPWVTGRWVLRGHPGTGKTTMLRHLAVRLADPGRENGAWIPVYEPLPVMVQEGGFVLDRLADGLERVGHPSRGLVPLLEELGQEGRLLLLLDGLDEVPEERRGRAEALLRVLAERWPLTPIVVTTRLIPYRPFDSRFREADLQPLDRKRREDFLSLWFRRKGGTTGGTGKRVKKALAFLEGNRGLWELAGNPLYLTLMALLLERDTPPAPNRSQLYDQILDLLLEGGHKRPPVAMEQPLAVRQALAYLAHGMTLDNARAESLAQLEKRLYDPDARRVRFPLEEVPRWRSRLRTFFQDLAERTAILGKHDPGSSDWRFLHRSFRESFAAEHLEGIYRGEANGGVVGSGEVSGSGAAAVLGHARSLAGQEGRWAEPYALLVGRIEEPDELVKALVEENRALGLRALATAQGLREETLAEVLELSEEWKERAEVYRRIPELVGEGERALLLLDRLRRGTTNGNDLYFLDVAVQEVAQRWPQHGEAASGLRRRLFDHISRPVGNLFEEVETPLDGRVPLWRAIPAGSFWMGSREGEGNDEERPRHRVTFRNGFGISAVPVTNAQYAAFDSEREPVWQAEVPETEIGDHPVFGVTWFEAISFCRWLATLGDRFRGARLPTEEEWEYACRAGTETRYWSGDEEADLARVGWYDANSGYRTHRVGEKPANVWGLHDVHGNVWEWTATPWDLEAYRKRAKGREVDPMHVDWEKAAPTEPSGGDFVFRGGSYWDVAGRARAAFWNRNDPEIEFGPGFGFRGRGFRVVLPVAPELSRIDPRS